MYFKLTTSAVAAAMLGAFVSVPAAQAAVTGSAVVAPGAATALRGVVDVAVSSAPNSAVSFQTLPNARCVIGAAGSRASLTVYADDRGIVPLHFTRMRGGAANGTLLTRCEARGSAVEKSVRLHVVAGAQPAAAVRPANAARPLVPRGVDPATLSPAEVSRLQLPPRPDAARDPKAYAEWREAVSMPVTRIGGTTILRTDVIHGPAKAARMLRAPKSGTKNANLGSNNWSGIADTGGFGQYTYWVAGKWTVPSVSTDLLDSAAYSSIWDGIDGWGSGDVIQNGTEQDAYYFPGFGSFSNYSAWYEFYPDNGSTTLPNFSVNPGDQIYAASWLCYDGAGQRYGCYYMQNLTQGEATPVYYELGARPDLFQGNSAEWIAERPTVGGTLHPLPQFGAFSFWWQHAYDSYAGAGRNACDENFDLISLYNGADELASTVPTSCDSSVFFWLNYQ